MGSKFEKLIDHPELPVKILEQIMANKKQCPRTAIWLVTPSGGGGAQAQAGGAKASGQDQQDKGKQTANAPQQHQSVGPASGTAGESKEGAGASTGAAGLPQPQQLCNVHKTILEKAEQAAAKSGKSVDEEQQKMLGADEPGNLPLQHMPVAPEEAQRAKYEALRIKDEEAKVKKEEEENATAGAGSGKR